MGNESKTENLVRQMLKANAYYDNAEIIVEEKISDNPRVNKLLANASKKGNAQGYPEFIIRSKSYNDFIIVIECKANTKQHRSIHTDKYADYAVDGALLYASYLSKEYDVIAIGVSGETIHELRISHYLYLKNDHKFNAILGNEILAFEDYYTQYLQTPQKFNQDYQALISFTQELNDILHSNKVKESQRSLLISGILIALQNPAFKQGFRGHRTAKNLVDNIVRTIVDELSNANLPEKRVSNLRYAFSFIQTHSTLSVDKEFLENLIIQIDQKINSFLKTHRYFDAIGQFYIEFLRYANNDKGLGIVLTPPHITELFVEMAEVNKDSVIVDNCCGTAGFLISGMKRMIVDAKGNTGKIRKIKNSQIIGIEFQDDIYALAISNMIIHGDGKTNIIQGDCFSMIEEVRRNFKPTIGLLNPPYKTKKEDREELEFILNNLEMLERNGKCIAIIPMSCVLGQSGYVLELKRKLLEAHTLEAVTSMPDELFHNSKVGVITIALVFTAHVPHPKGKKTWFGYWKDDGFVKAKNKGRIDKYNRWPSIKDEWVNLYKNREIKAGYCVMKEVNAHDEWCAEAYMETDYSKLTQNDFKEVIKKFVAYEFLNKV